MREQFCPMYARCGEAALTSPQTRLLAPCWIMKRRSRLINAELFTVPLRSFLVAVETWIDLYKLCYPAIM